MAAEGSTKQQGGPSSPVGKGQYTKLILATNQIICKFLNESVTHELATCNNFSEDRWRKAALKNAFALLGKQRFTHAAAFFLLSGSLKDALDICIGKNYAFKKYVEFALNN